MSIASSYFAHRKCLDVTELRKLFFQLFKSCDVFAVLVMDFLAEQIQAPAAPA